MQNRLRALPLVGGAVLAATAGMALGFVPWTNQAGATGNFTWANGGSDNGLFGSPTIVGNSFVFFPSGFRAQSVNGVPDARADRLSVDLTAIAGFFFTHVVIEEFGDYAVAGPQGGFVNVLGVLRVTDLIGGGVHNGPLVTNPPMPVFAGAGAWTGLASVDVSNELPVWRRINVQMFNEVIAVSVPGGVAYIEKKVVGAGVRIRIIPTPGSAALLLSAAGVAAFRRRR